MDIGEVNSLSCEEFVEIFGNVVEKCPLVAAAVWSRRPFNSVSDIEAAIADFIDSMPNSGKEGILRCHPDLAGRDLQRGTLTRESQAEQSQVGLTQLDPAEAAHINALNAQYKLRFGFPFVICARANDRPAILRQLSQRLGNQPARELPLAVEEVKKICHLRLQNLLCPVLPGPAQLGSTPPKL
ncbi:2-oxo-4-hydroxy-4-carboxy-5-ureidoimidazoline decarboxylase [Anguilla rostrata]|uniref:2-oxo-4-hydroxy-4-carboxy-5-ureidoimidazoline decarboxylase n=1 Tax=Anguilla rostrata TaxID=7938 RepID=UPI0030CF9E1B